MINLIILWFASLSSFTELTLLQLSETYANLFLTFIGSIILLLGVCPKGISVGECDGSFPRWYFNHETKRCETFIYSGCKGDGNNFLTLEQCDRTCNIPVRDKGKWNSLTELRDNDIDVWCT